MVGHLLPVHDCLFLGTALFSVTFAFPCTFPPLPTPLFAFFKLVTYSWVFLRGACSQFRDLAGFPTQGGALSQFTDHLLLQGWV